MGCVPLISGHIDIPISVIVVDQEAGDIRGIADIFGREASPEQGGSLTGAQIYMSMWNGAGHITAPSRILSAINKTMNRLKANSLDDRL
jgi:hypothetical protein